MTPGMTVDTRQFREAARQLAATDRRSCVDFINGQLMFVAVQAVRETHKADRNRIRAALGQIGTKLKFVFHKGGGHRKGKVKSIRAGDMIVAEDSLAYRILFKRLVEDKKSVFPGPIEMERQVKKFIAARSRSAGFIASGWLAALAAIARVVKQKPGYGAAMADPNVRQVGHQPKGKAFPAMVSQGSMLVATIENTALLEHWKTKGHLPVSGDPSGVAKLGLQKALAIAAQSMMAKLAERLNRDNKQFNAGSR